MKKLIFIILLITPWFWSLKFPSDLFKINLRGDIKEARLMVEWERGKIPIKFSNVLFSNWPMKIISQRLDIVLENLDIGNYFFSGHPRERVGVEERQKFFFFELILLIVGFTNSNIKKYKKLLIIYSITSLLFVFIFKWRSFYQTLPLSVPFIILMALSLEKVLKWPKKWLIIFGSTALFEILFFCILNFKLFIK